MRNMDKFYKVISKWGKSLLLSKEVWTSFIVLRLDSDLGVFDGLFLTESSGPP